jgi:hypothetical protein
VAANLVDEGYQGRFTASCIVLENTVHGPQLCLGFVGMSSPPWCGGPDVVGVEPYQTPCPRPPGGWRPIDRSTATPQAFDCAVALARADPGYCTHWVDQNLPAGAANPMDNDRARIILNVATTADTATLERPTRQDAYRNRRRAGDEPAVLSELAALGHELQERRVRTLAWVAGESPAMYEIFLRNVRHLCAGVVAEA